MPTKTKTLLGGLSLIAFAAIALGVSTHAAWLAQLDAAASTLATRAIDPMNTALFKVVATLGSPATVIGLTALLCLWCGSSKNRSSAYGLPVCSSAAPPLRKASSY